MNLRRNLKPKECLAAIMGAIIAAICIGFWHFMPHHYQWPDIPVASFDVKTRLRLAESIQKGLIVNAPIDEERKILAIRVLKEEENNTVVFLWNCVAKHNIYGHTLEIFYIDRSACVENIVYEEEDQNETTKVSRYVLFDSKEMWGRGCFHSKTILCASNDKEITKSNINRDEPERLILPLNLYNNIISGKGKMVLLDKNGITLDSLGITLVDFKR